MQKDTRKQQPQRIAESVNIRSQLRDHHLDRIPFVIDTLIPALNEFARDGISASGSVFLKEIDRKLEYTLTNNPRLVSFVRIVGS
jgi:hypothetical protein